MAKVFIIGAAGKVGAQLTKRLSDNGHQVSALHRKPEQAETLKNVGAQPVFGDIQKLNADGLTALVAGHDVVVFTAGAGGASIELTNAIDGTGLELAVTAAEQAAVNRFILVSAFPDAGRGKPTSEGFENYMRVKRLADVRLVNSALDWVILRPGTLTDEPGTGLIRADLAIPYGSVARADVATTLAGLIEQQTISHKIIELTSGEEPVVAVLERFAR